MNISQGVIEIATGSLSLRRFGAGRPVLCLHATGHDGRDFGAFAARVGHACEVIAVDWPGHGASPPDGHAPRAGGYADIALAVVEVLGLDRPVLVGNSIGGAAALITAARAPGRFAGLVLCNAGGLAPVDGMARAAIALMVAMFEAGARGAAWYPAAFRAYYERLVLPAAPARERRAAIVEQGRTLAPLLADAWRGFAAPEADLRDMARTLDLPVWCAWARSDRIVSWARARAAATGIPGARATLFRGGHAAFLEDPDRFAAAFLAFLAALDAQTPVRRSDPAAA